MRRRRLLLLALALLAFTITIDTARLWLLPLVNRVLGSKWRRKVHALLKAVNPEQMAPCQKEAHAAARRDGAGTAWPAALRTPDARCPMYLDSWNQEAGLGHSFMSFNSLLALSAALRLTLHAKVTTGAHGLNAAAVQRLFFGDYFNSPLPNGDVIRVPVTPASVCAAVRERRGAACQTPVIFELDWPMDAADEGLNVTELRAAFVAQRTSSERPAPTLASGRSAAITVAAHIRRGDIAAQLEPGLVYSARGTPTATYLRILQRLLPLLDAHSSGRLGGGGGRGGGERIRLVLHIEDERAGPSAVPEIGGGVVDFTRLPADVSIGPRDSLEAFEAMCASDVLITARSGFSHMVAVLCERPVVMALPFWHSYRDVPNAVLLRSVQVPSRPDGQQGDEAAGAAITRQESYTWDEEALLRLLRARGLSRQRRPTAARASPPDEPKRPPQSRLAV